MQKSVKQAVVKITLLCLYNKNNIAFTIVLEKYLGEMSLTIMIVLFTFFSVVGVTKQEQPVTVQVAQIVPTIVFTKLQEKATFFQISEVFFCLGCDIKLYFKHK